jgi:hypothetical protein|tara:strand:+ start:6839 stop:7141 length:303 start_codon:yes stop_codon:yes gene_type:complete
MYRGIETELLDRATIIMEDYIPILWNSSNYRLNILDVICENTDWTKEMIRFVRTHEEDTELYEGLDFRTMITQTIMHDIGGLMRNDEHFLPRIYSPNKNI